MKYNGWICNTCEEKDPCVLCLQIDTSKPNWCPYLFQDKKAEWKKVPNGIEMKKVNLN